MLSEIIEEITNVNNSNTNRAIEDVYEDIQKYTFAAQDTALYLDTHPNDLRVLERHNYYADKLKDANEEFGLVKDALCNACAQFGKSREKEGQALYNDIKTKLSLTLGLIEEIEKRSPQTVELYQQKLKDKVAELLGGTRIDEGLVATEITIFADKVCVDEETVRLRSHIVNMEDTLSKDEPVGRKLDFIAQEMNREANTILSKANDAELSSLAIDLKTGIEKIREQIQNIE